MDQIKIKEIPLTQSFWQRLAREDNFNATVFAQERFPDLIIHQIAFVNNLPMYPDGAVAIKFSEKSEDDLYMERFEFMVDSTPFFYKTIPKKEIKFGCCPECERYVLNWKPMFGGLAPEWWATMRERGINPATGHSESCSKQK